MVILLAIAVVAVVAPVTGVVLVALAIRREDAALSLSRRPRGVGQAAARRLLGFHGSGFEVPAGRGGAGARPFPPEEEILLGSGDFPADGDWGWRSAPLTGAGRRGRR